MERSTQRAGSRLLSLSSFGKSPLALAVGLTLAGSQLAIAQEEADDGLEEVTVTGTRIQLTSGMTTPTPVAALSATEIAAMAPGNLTEAMTQLPQFYASATAENFNTGTNGFFVSPGGGSLNLRGIGSRRTLTLLDGRRVVPATVYGGPDINMFPESMLRQVETVTGGASAAYGTDAVSGVINYILDTQFDGFRASAQMGRTTHGDGDGAEYSLSLGHSVTDQLHVLLSVEHAEQDPIIGYQGRDWYQNCGLIQNPGVTTGTGGNAGTDPSLPRLIPACHLTSLVASYDGIATGPAALGRLAFNSDGTVSPFAPSSLVSNGSNAQSVIGGGSGTDNNIDRPTLRSQTARNNAFLYADYDVTDNFNVYVQGMYGDQKLRATNAGGLFFNGGAFQTFTIYQDNAFLPASLRAQMLATNTPSFNFGRIGHSSDIANDAYVQNDTRMMAATLGFKSLIASDGFFNDWNVEGYYQYGKNDLDAGQEGGIRVDRIFHAIDAVVDPATGTVRCRVTVVSGLLPDCVPLNLFGRGNASAAAVDWVTGFDPNVPVSVTPYLPGYPAETYSYVGDEYKHRIVALRQRVFEISASGQVAEGWAGPISAAFGAHYRKESVDQKVQASQGNVAADPFMYPAWCNDGATQAQCLAQIASGTRPAGNIGVRGVPNGVATNSVEFQFSKVPFIRGDFDIKEVFGEALVPLLSDMAWLQQLNFSGALRWADYAGSGSIWSYKAGLDAALTDSFRLRGTYSRDVRAANIGERFDRTGGFANVVDRGLTGNPSYGITIVSGGNPLLDPEEADTFTVGFVYRPMWLEGFDVSVDWLNVSLQDAIESLSSQEIVDACHVRNDTDQCARITRDPASGNRITFINQVQQNLAKSKITGVDAEIGYSRDINLLGGGERLGLRLFASWLDENSRTNSQGVKTDFVGSVTAQLLEWKATASMNYTRGPFRWNMQARYLDGGLLSTSYNVFSPTLNRIDWNVADNTIGSIVYLDTRVGYDIPMGDGSIELFANVNNLLDRDPPLVLGEFGGLGASANQTSSGYDLIGRRFTLGFNIRF